MANGNGAGDGFLWYDDEGGFEDDSTLYDSDVLVEGSPNTLPSVSDRPETSQGSVWSTIQNVLGSIGSTARDVGSAVGTIRRDVRNAGTEYRRAQQNAYQGNSLGQWWQYSTQSEKLLIGLAAFAAVLVIVKS